MSSRMVPGGSTTRTEDETRRDELEVGSRNGQPRALNSGQGGLKRMERERKESGKMEERRAEESRGGWEEKRAGGIYSRGRRESECGRIRYSPGWGRGIVQELCSVLFYSTLLDDIMTTVYG